MPNLAVPPHVHDEYQIGLTVDAPGEYEYRGETHPIPIKSLSVLHPGEVHVGRSLGTGEAKIITRKIYIPPMRMQQVITAITDRHSVSLPFIPTPILIDRSLLNTFLELHESLATTLQLEQDSRLLSALIKLVLHHAESPPEIRSYKSHQAVQRVREYLHDHYAENIALDQLADIAQLSPFHLCRTFTREMGLPPHRYQLQVRIAKAKRLLICGISLEQVALDTGFSHQSHFGRHFKQIVGVTPGCYVSSNNVIDNQR